METIEDRVMGVVVEVLRIRADEVTDATIFVDDLGADSLDTVELVMALEKEFGCEIPDHVVSSMETVGDVVRYCASHIASSESD